ncbi:MAG: glycosyltransferase [Candidatus Thiodiazotropha sp.]
MMLQDTIKKLFLVITLLFFLSCIALGISNNSYLHDLFYYSIFSYLIFVTLRHVLFLFFAIVEGRIARQLNSEITPLVSIIVPAYNEAAVIKDALSGLLDLQYSNTEIIVIDDGSTDQTETIVREFSSTHPEHAIRVYSQTNAGKACALNSGIFHARGEFILCVDADSRLTPDALNNAFKHFEDPAVGAVGGFIAVRNPQSLIAQFQQLEYLISLNFIRKALSYFGAVTIIPGPVGLFRREAINAVFGYREEKDIFAEDADLTVRLLSAGWKVKGDTSMVSATEVPIDVFSVLRQRYRWKRGIFQAFFDNFTHLVTANSIRGMIIGIYLALEAMILPVLNFGLTLFLLVHFLYFGEFQLILKYYLILVSLDLSTFIYVFYRHDNKFKSFVIYFIQKFSYSYLMQAWGIFALLDEWRSSKMSWDKLDRIGEAAKAR